MNVTSHKHRRTSPEALPATVYVETRCSPRGYIAAIRTVGQAWCCSRVSEHEAVKAVCDEFAVTLNCEAEGEDYLCKGWSASRVGEGMWIAHLRRGLELRKRGAS
jgi:hypothetical protein